MHVIRIYLHYIQHVGLMLLKKEHATEWEEPLIKYLAAFAGRDEPQSMAGKPCGFHNSYFQRSQFVLATRPKLAQCNANGGLVFLRSRGLPGASPPDRSNGECQC